MFSDNFEKKFCIPKYSDTDKNRSSTVNNNELMCNLRHQISVGPIIFSDYMIAFFFPFAKPTLVFMVLKTHSSLTISYYMCTEYVVYTVYTESYFS